MSRTARGVALAAVALALGLVACRSKQEPATLPQVRVHVTLGDEAAGVLVQLARAQGIAAVELVDGPAGAEAYWLQDPLEVLALGDRVQPGALPPPVDTDARLLDPRGRFLPVGARARVFLVNPRATPFEPRALRDLADPRVSGRVAIVHPTSEGGVTTYAVVAQRFGISSVSQFLAALAKNDPIVVGSDAEVRDRVTKGEAAFGLTDSRTAAAAAASAAGLEVVVPDQDGRGAILLPTAVAVAPGASEAAVKLAHWLAGPEAEQVLVARVPGLMPLRDGVPVPVGVQPARSVRAMLLDWDRLAAGLPAVRAALEGWPEQWRR